MKATKNRRNGRVKVGSECKKKNKIKYEEMVNKECREKKRRKRK